ncbi:MAG TPA: hypothetical protein VEI57_02905 [Nitrospirota bacterium]|nr:hypothetical protein [Nitrospirota bacterium]
MLAVNRARIIFIQPRHARFSGQGKRLVIQDLVEGNQKQTFCNSLFSLVNYPHELPGAEQDAVGQVTVTMRM